MTSLFRVSRRCHDGLVLLGLLAERYESRAFVPLEAAASASLSGAGYLEQIVGPLRGAGIVEGRRGVRGGYRLTRNPAAVTLAEAIGALEGPVALVECQKEGACLHEQGCGSRKVWNALQSRIIETLRSMTIRELI